MKKILFVSTLKDVSVFLFQFKEVATSMVDVDVLFYEEDCDVVTNHLLENSFDYIYFRDPFNSINLDKEHVKKNIEIILENKGESHVLDGIKTYDDFLHEDKWRQYELYSDFMPQTSLITDVEQFDPSASLLKRRISCRSRGIVFSKDKITKNLSEYVMQERQTIIKEYRVFYVFGEIYPIASIRSPKTEVTKSIVLHTEQVSEKVKSFAEEVMKNSTLDVVGLDIAETEDSLVLFEVNRSPLFNTFFKNSGINLAENIVEKMLLL